MASRQGLKLRDSREYADNFVGRQWNGFPSGIETKQVVTPRMNEVGRQWNGFPSGIETEMRFW